MWEARRSEEVGKKPALTLILKLGDSLNEDERLDVVDGGITDSKRM